jgi:phenylalanyl-tRNA synthetase alpha chain
MDSANSLGQLHPIEKLLLKRLSAVDSVISIDGLVDLTGLGIDQVRRGIEWLKFKNLISLNEKSVSVIQLGNKGRIAIEKGLPERRLVNAIRTSDDQRMPLSTILQKKGNVVFDEPKESSAAFENALRNKWVEQGILSSGEKALVLLPSADSLSTQEKMLQKLNLQENIDVGKLSSEENEAYNILKKRPDYLIEKKQKTTEIMISQHAREQILHDDISSDIFIDHNNNLEQRAHLTQEIISSGAWKKIKLRPIDVQAPVPSLHIGRKNPLIELIDEIKEIFIGLGFMEIEGSLVQSGFWNFDALFTPQDHPSREMQDTFYVSGIKQKNFATAEQIQRISEIHKEVWDDDWDIEEAKRTVMRTHTTPVTIKYLAEKNPQDSRIFSVGRVFRNEKLSYKHLAEFTQVEGVATGQNVTLRGLMGLQTEFYSKLGIKKVKFWPTFFPYTEPSLQSMVYNDSLEKWVELFGMGIIRPEIVKTLKLKNPVLAWGGGVERIAMLRFKLNDVRDLYSNKLSWLRGVPKCQL